MDLYLARTQGTRLETYAIKGPYGSGIVCVNGAAAHLNAPGDLVILCTYCEMDDQEARHPVGTCVRVDANNAIVDTEPETPGPSMPEKVD